MYFGHSKFSLMQVLSVLALDYYVYVCVKTTTRLDIPAPKKKHENIYVPT